MLHNFMLEKTFLSNDFPILTVSTPYPYLQPPPNCHARIHRYYEKLSETWLSYWKRLLYPQATQAQREAQAQGMPFPPWRAQLSHLCTWQDETYLSLFSQAQVSIPGRLPYLVGSAVTWTYRDGFPCPYSDFLPLSARQIRTQIRTKVETLQKQEGSLLFETSPLLAEKRFSPHRFFLSEDAIHFFYPMGVLGRISEGLPTIPLDLPNISSQPLKNSAKT